MPWNHAKAVQGDKESQGPGLDIVLKGTCSLKMSGDRSVAAAEN